MILHYDVSLNCNVSKVSRGFVMYLNYTMISFRIFLKNSFNGLNKNLRMSFYFQRCINLVETFSFGFRPSLSPKKIRYKSIRFLETLFVTTPLSVDLLHSFISRSHWPPLYLNFTAELSHLFITRQISTTSLLTERCTSFYSILRIECSVYHQRIDISYYRFWGS